MNMEIGNEGHNVFLGNPVSLAGTIKGSKSLFSCLFLLKAGIIFLLKESFELFHHFLQGGIYVRLS